MERVVLERLCGEDGGGMVCRTGINCFWDFDCGFDQFAHVLNLAQSDYF